MPSSHSRERPRELRLSKRFHVEIPVSFLVEHPPGAGTETAYHLSVDGCKVTNPPSVSSGLYLTIRLHRPNDPLAVGGSAGYHPMGHGRRLRRGTLQYGVRCTRAVAPSAHRTRIRSAYVTRPPQGTDRRDTIEDVRMGRDIRA